MIPERPDDDEQEFTELKLSLGIIAYTVQKFYCWLLGLCTMALIFLLFLSNNKWLTIAACLLLFACLIVSFLAVGGLNAEEP